MENKTTCVKLVEEYLSRIDNSSSLNIFIETFKSSAIEKAKKVDAVQKAQTKRWLKNEYSVALRAGVEDEVEEGCEDEDREHERMCALATLGRTKLPDAAALLIARLDGCTSQLRSYCELVSAQGAAAAEPLRRQDRHAARANAV